MECRKSLLVFIKTYTKPGGILKNMVILYRLLFSGSLIISLSATQLRSLNSVFLFFQAEKKNNFGVYGNALVKLIKSFPSLSSHLFPLPSDL